MKPPRRIFGRSAVAAVLLALAVPHGAAPDAHAAGLFSGMAGSWRGDGSIKYTSGQSEGVRCTATYTVADDGNKIQQNLTCAFASGGAPLKIKSDIAYKTAAGVLTGTWVESSYGLHGWVSGSATPGSIKALVKSGDGSFTVRVSVVTKGSQQTVLMRPEKLDVTEVSVQLTRAG